ncbi:MAG: FAD-dependent oxidoreductase [Gammaproteobacteria bacterium]|nr:FAD-dependent oxidoreductase [Gammaproteobacteria bacterium]
MSKSVVIAGAGHAAGQVVTSLRQHNFEGRIVLVGDEPYLPYQRPPLSKKFLAGEMPAERLYVKPASFYEDAGVELHLDTTITAIDRDDQCLRTGEADPIAYDQLVLALGSRARQLPVEGARLQGVHYLRSIADVEGIRENMEAGRRLVIIGAGYIGLEVAAVAQQAGLDVTVIEMADRVMSRVVSPEISDFYQIEHTNQGVRFRLATGVDGLHGKKRVKYVTTSEGEDIPADLVVIGVGILPNTELAADAGLTVDDGISVDDHCRTDDPDIFAVGDCTTHPNAIYDRQLRLESVHNAVEQAKTAAANICGKDSAYSQVPWFWSDQYDLKLQIAGLSEGYDDVVIRGNPAERAFSCLYLRNGRLIACDAINAPRDFVQSKQLIADQVDIDVEKLADPGVALKELSA